MVVILTPIVLMVVGIPGLPNLCNPIHLELQPWLGFTYQLHTMAGDLGLTWGLWITCVKSEGTKCGVNLLLLPMPNKCYLQLVVHIIYIYIYLHQHRHRCSHIVVRKPKFHSTSGISDFVLFSSLDFYSITSNWLSFRAKELLGYRIPRHTLDFRWSSSGKKSTDVW